LSEAFAYAEVKPGMQVLDVGCGRGEILRHVTKLGAHAFGVDYAEVAVKLSREATRDEPQPIGVPHRRQALPYASGAPIGVDVRRGGAPLPWELDAALQNAHRVLKPE
jgi:cyclopropane fatty-acyl-phospholipid synthase-like methyltransferase